jgi:oligopeptide/dipeptide ABC transporter, ATP-binding protein, C-terminal domain
MTALLRLENVTKRFPVGRREITAVDSVSLEIHEGEILCMVGESGCGKTTTGKIISGLLRPTSGTVLFRGQDIWQMDRTAFSRFRKDVQVIHQDPYASLNPVRTVYKTLSAPLFRHRLVKNRKEATQKIIELLEIVGLTPPEDFIHKYPHQLSGGQRQRVSVARALTVNPRLIVADEATSMVDVSIRISLLNMLLRLRNELNVTFVFVTHDLSLAKYFAWDGRIAVMYVGRIVELSPTPQLIQQPRHPYTQALLSAIPEADPKLTRSKQRFQLRSHEIPSLLNLPPGCAFHPRCPWHQPGLCDQLRPQDELLQDGRQVACHVVSQQDREAAG